MPPHMENPATQGGASVRHLVWRDKSKTSAALPYNQHGHVVPFPRAKRERATVEGSNLCDAPAFMPATASEAQNRARELEAAARRCARLSGSHHDATGLTLLALAGHYAKQARGLWKAAEVLA